MNNSTTIKRGLLLLSCAALLLAQMAAPAATLNNRWSFNEAASGTNVIDSVSSAVGYLVGPGAFLNGSGQVTLDGVSGDYVQLPCALLNGLTAVSFEGWVYSDASPDNV